jgi:hypothetical protein
MKRSTWRRIRHHEWSRWPEVSSARETPDYKGGEHHEALEPWIGRWLNDGYTINNDGGRGETITTCDVYEWAPGGFFILHTAYGRIGDLNVGGTEIIGYDEASGGFLSYFFDSRGNALTSTLQVHGNTRTYRGDSTRATVDFSDGSRVQTVLHERTDDGQSYSASMKVTLSKVE